MPSRGLAAACRLEGVRGKGGMGETEAEFPDVHPLPATPHSQVSLFSPASEDGESDE